MTPEFIIGFGKQAMEITLLMAAPMLLAGLVVGVLISIFQAVTSIQEMTLTFIPKILAVMAALVLSFPWMLQLILRYTENVFMNIPSYIR
ncbi:MAG: flagellar biosynthesis protein FliQ [Candidatus Tectomicrobia bacterium]|uniref:Flagellar biosynthetic protein FliQ n=1 Tax=Tectimicrobiota bacterium TaxID=2528274 RepID=A0A932LZW1_UNCTE|nr:flagellar biosynthesis protein FliQ [Candidatus Tectomicrobia bacterium]